MQKTNSNFWEVEWGPDEAKGDNNLAKYFVKIPEYDDLLKGEYRYIIGRKGTGKTAIIEKILNEIDGEYNKFSKYLTLRNFPIQTIRGLKDRSLGDKSQFVPIWKFLIVIELCKLVISDQKAFPSESVLELKKFINDNFPTGLGFTETLKELESNQNKVSILSKWIGLENSSSESIERFTSVHFQKATDLIISKLKSIKSECVFYMFFDELDEGYNSNDKNLNLLILALLRAVEDCFLDLKNYLSFRPILALRSDIYNNLEDNDLNKLDDYLINLKWTTESHSPYSLYDLVNARINASINVLNPSKAWECVSYNNDPKVPKKIRTLWDFMYNRTFERPRDIIKFLKICKKLSYTGKISFEVMRTAEIDYSDWFYKEFRDEIQSHFPIWQEATQSIIKLGNGIFSFEQIKPYLDEDPTIKAYMTSNNKSHHDVLESLFDFGLIGTLSNSNRWFFKYKDHNLPFDTKQNMIVHFGFTRKFRIKTY